ncbi:metallophosphoesterase [candidate division KSB1 bacterium]|nr:metallophosphoesterase [candidate division KSB1 bacterium]
MDNIKTVGIISDSHDNMTALQKAVDVFTQRGVDLVIHAGDLVAPFTARILKKLECPLIITFGNNDGELFGLKNVFQGQIFDPPHKIIVNNKKVLILHDPVLLDEFQAGDQFDVIIYGHLHKVDIRKGRPLIINPGESCGWVYGKSTIAIWDVETDNVELIELK